MNVQNSLLNLCLYEHIYSNNNNNNDDDNNNNISINHHRRPYMFVRVFWYLVARTSVVILGIVPATLNCIYWVLAQMLATLLILR